MESKVMRGVDTSFTFESLSLSYTFKKEIQPVRIGAGGDGGATPKKQRNQNACQRPSFTLSSTAPLYNFLPEQ